MVVDPGRYRKPMTLWRPLHGTPSARSGEQPVTAEKVADMWCQLLPTAGNESLAAAQVSAETSHLIHTWFRRDVAPDATMWFLYGSRRFNVLSVINVGEENEEWEFQVKEYPGG